MKNTLLNAMSYLVDHILAGREDCKLVLDRRGLEYLDKHRADIIELVPAEKGHDHAKGVVFMRAKF